MTVTVPGRPIDPAGANLFAPRRTGAPSNLERLAAGVALFALGLRHFLHSGVTVADILDLILAVVWVGRLSRFSFARAFIVLGIVTVGWGVALGSITGTDHRMNLHVRLSSTVLLLGIVLGIGVVLWARTVLSLGAVGLWFGSGMLVDAYLRRGADASNPWKFHWAVPVAIVLLSLTVASRQNQRRRAAPAGVVALLFLAVVSAFSDSRSYAATFVITALLVAWQGRPRALSHRSSAWLSLAMMVAVTLSTYWLVTKLLVAGYLGAASQARTIAQLDQSGSVIAGGRPELQATLALMRDRPMGFGVGIVPTGRDILVAKSGLNSINYNPNNGYVEKYMFGGHIELHSLLGDLWAGWGLAGLLLLVAMAVVLLRGLAVTIAGGLANPAGLFLIVWDLWNLFFSPIYSSAPTLTIGLGLAFIARRPQPALTEPASEAA